jgi:hypothetical protein
MEEFKMKLIRKPAPLPWTIRMLCDYYEAKKVTSDLIVQRGFVWERDIDKKSLLIDSVFTRWIPAPLLNKRDKIYRIIDGQQRTKVFLSFRKNEFALTNVTDCLLYEDIVEENGEKSEVTKTIDLNGLYYKDLPQGLKDAFDNYPLGIYYFDDLDDEEETETFYRVNNGKSLTNTETIWIKTVSKNIIIELSQHVLFGETLSKTAIKNKQSRKIIQNAYVTLFKDDPCFETKYLKPIMEKEPISESQKIVIEMILDKLYEVYSEIKDEYPKVASRMTKPTHLLALLKVAKEATPEELKGFILTFFNEKGRTTTISETYNRNAGGSGTAKPESVQKRLAIMEDEYNKYISKAQTHKDQTALEQLEKEDKELKNEEIENYVNCDPALTDKELDEEMKQVEEFFDQLDGEDKDRETA